MLVVHVLLPSNLLMLHDHFHLLDDVRVVLNEGMPHHKNPFDKGRLIINFKVQ